MHNEHMTLYTDSYPLNSNEKLWSYPTDTIGQKWVRYVLFWWWACGHSLDMFSGFTGEWGRKGLKKENNEERFSTANFRAISHLIISYKSCWERQWGSFYKKYRVFLDGRNCIWGSRRRSQRRMMIRVERWAEITGSEFWRKCGCHFAQNWNNDMLCSILKYAGFLKIYFTLYFNPTILIIMNMF